MKERPQLEAEKSVRVTHRSLVRLLDGVAPSSRLMRPVAVFWIAGLILVGAVAAGPTRLKLQPRGFKVGPKVPELDLSALPARARTIVLTEYRHRRKKAVSHSLFSECISKRGCDGC